MKGRIDRCRACLGSLDLVLCDLGMSPLANSYPAASRDPSQEPVYPLRVVVCDECRMAQLDFIVDAATIFTDYAYRSSISSTFVEHARTFAAEMIYQLRLGDNSLVIEAASNDGYLLQHFVRAGVPCLGIEPAANLAKLASAAGVPTETAFLDARTAEATVERLGRKADLVIANNVLAHVPQINDFVTALHKLVRRDGVISVEFPYLVNLIDDVQFDTIYHEHYAYWSLLAVERLFARHGLTVFDAESITPHGGSLRIQASPEAPPATSRLTALREMEQRWGVPEPSFYSGFDARKDAVLSNFRNWMADQSAAGRRIAAYGAAAKGNTFLNAAGVVRSDLIAVADLSPSKQGRLLPGSQIPVISPSALMDLEPDDILILPWNIVDEIVAQLRSDGFSGGLWTAIPEMRCH